MMNEEHKVFTPTVGNVIVWRDDKEHLIGADTVDSKTSIVRLGSVEMGETVSVFLVEEKIDIGIETRAIVRHLRNMGWEVEKR